MTESTTNERLSALESDIRNFDARLGSMERKSDENFAALRQSLATQKQPLTAFAGWAAVILTLVFAFGSPLMKADRDLLTRMKDMHANQGAQIDLLLNRELEDAYARGSSDQAFETLKEQIRSAINNRKDIDAKHISAQADLQRQIKNVEHALDNGLGRRIDEKIDSIKTDIDWLKKMSLFNDPGLLHEKNNN